MSDFKVLKAAVQNQFDNMKQHPLFKVDVDKDFLWETYLGSFPEGSNPPFRERTVHDCNACKSFIRAVGGVVALVDGQIISIWDINVGGHYQVVANAMSAIVKAGEISNIFLSAERTAGRDKTLGNPFDAVFETWEHLFVEIPPGSVVIGEGKGCMLSNFRSTKDVALRSFLEITDSAVETVQELIDNGNLYRGDENRSIVARFRLLKKLFLEVEPSSRARDLFCWEKIALAPGTLNNPVFKIRNSAIGTLLVDLSEGKDLEYSVKSFESKVAPQNYKRTTALITPTMIRRAQEKIGELGFTSALPRRHAVAGDISINDVLYADRMIKSTMKDGVESVFDDMMAEMAVSMDTRNAEEVSIDTFLSEVLPTVSVMDIMFENRHCPNLVSLVAPVDPSAKGMFKWPSNNFSWAYNGEVTDSIKERVKNAGGKVDGDLRCSLSWFNYDDLDLHMEEPGGFHIYYPNSQRISPFTDGNLDIDMNAGSGDTREPVENICYPDRRRMQEGTYTLSVHNFNKREAVYVGFEVEIEFDGVLYSFPYPQAVRNEERIIVARLEYSHANGLKVIGAIPSSQAVKKVWGINTSQIHRVSMIMNSPNHWNGMAIGNRHTFFILDGCVNDERPRGFFNEFMTDSLRDHRKVFEVLGSKMRAEVPRNPNDQLSGVGFSSTQRNNVFCRINDRRTIKITF